MSHSSRLQVMSHDYNLRKRPAGQGEELKPVEVNEILLNLFYTHPETH